MAPRRGSSFRAQRDSKGFTAGLSSAILEWVLIFLLFVDAFFSYLVTKFARSCELQAPCLLCSRLDHVFGNEKSGFYWDLVCAAHKQEFSSLVYCKIHEKLADIHGMCETCLSSFVDENKLNSESYKFFVGKPGKNHKSCVRKDPLVRLVFGSPSDNVNNPLKREMHCSCCNEPWKLKSYYAHRFLPTKSTFPEVSELDDRSPGSVRQNCENLFNGLKKEREKTSGLMTSSHRGHRGLDPLCHVGYTELKITSDSESEVPYSDDDGVSELVGETDYIKEQVVPHHIPSEPQASGSDLLFESPPDDPLLDKLNDQTSEFIPSLSVLDGQVDVSNSYHATSSANAVLHGLEELDLEKVEQKPIPPALSELISLDDVPSSSNTVEAANNASGESLDFMGIGNLIQGLQESTSESAEVCESEDGVGAITAPCVKTEQLLNDHCPPMLNLMDLTGACRQAFGNKGGQASGTLTELLAAKESKVNEDLKLLLSQISPARGFELAVNDPSPKVHARGIELSSNDMGPQVQQLNEELKSLDVPFFTGALTVQLRPSIDRSESGFESLDGSVISEIDGESAVDRLRRQIEHDRKSLSALYKELEEERNASAVAANQALAMITRLQEEKASLHMEALQYLRMMEEQAEYDVDALEKANDLLAEKEKECQDLEAELEIYRNNQDEMIVENNKEPYGLEVAAMCMEHSDLCSIGNNTKDPCAPQSTEKSKYTNKPENTGVVAADNHVSISDSLIDFEHEKSYILERLKKLEWKLSPGSGNGVLVEMVNGKYSGKQTHGLNDLRHLHSEEGYHENGRLEEYTPPGQKVSSPFSEAGNQFETPDSSISNRVIDFVYLQNEVLDLNERMEALEAERNFLKHSVNSLQNGDEGLKFIQEIALHLRELRNSGIQRTEKDAT